MNTFFTQPAKSSSTRARLHGATLAKAFFAALVAGLGFAGTANAQTDFFQITGGTTPVSTQYVSTYGGTWYTSTPFVSPTITASGAQITSSYSNSNFSNITSTLGSQGNYIVLAPNGQTGGLESSITLTGLNLTGITSPVLKLNIIKKGNGNPAFKVDFTSSTGVVTTNEISETSNWSSAQVAIPTNIVKIKLYRISNSDNGNNAYTFWAMDDVTITGNNAPVNPCAGTTGLGFDKVWFGAGAPGSTSTSTAYNVDANWCPSGVPTSAHTVLIHSNSTTAINISQPVSVAKLKIVNSSTTASTLPISIDAGVTYTIESGGLEVTSSGTGGVRISSTANANTPAIDLKGNLLGTADLIISNAHVKFSSNSAQFITTVNPVAFSNLTIANSGTEPVNVLLNSSISVSGALKFSDGVLATGSNTVTYGTGATLVETNDSYLKGNLVVLARNISSVTPQDFGGLGLTLTTGSGAAGPYATNITRYTGASAIGATNGTSILRIFDIDVENPNGHLLNATMKFDFFTQELNGISPADLNFFHQSQGGLWGNMGFDANTLVNPLLAANNNKGSLTKSGINSFSPWTLGGTVNPLPVELISFSVKRDADAAVLNWATASEENNAGYEIEASSDNRNFTSIGYVNAVQTAYQGAEYNFIEPKAASHGVRYYRLTQFDLDGTKTILGVRTVNFNSTGVSVITGPNPFTYGFAALVESDKAQLATLTLTDALGREVARQQTKLVRGVNQVDFNGAELSNGSYLLSVQLEAEVLTVKVNKQ